MDRKIIWMSVCALAVKVILPSSMSVGVGSVFAATGGDELDWIDGCRLPMEGKAFNNVEFFYDRMPCDLTTNVNDRVRGPLRHHTAGMQFRFKTSSPTVSFVWTPFFETNTPLGMGGAIYNGLGMAHMSAIGVSGIDVYLQGGDGKWHYVKSGFIYPGEGGCTSTGRIDRLNVRPGTPILVNLPLYNGLKSFVLGIERGATVSALGARASGVSKPVVFYGTSITQGGCASRPGLSFVNIVGRDLDVPVINLGFSGHGMMEYELSERLAEIDASCYVLDCVANMDARPTGCRSIPLHYEPFVRNLRRLRPQVPIVLAEHCTLHDIVGASPLNAQVRAIYEKLRTEGWTKLQYVSSAEMSTGDDEGSVDHTHANDYGMRVLARVYGRAVRRALGK